MYISVLAATVFIFLASSLLSVLLTINFLRKSLTSYIFWSTGMWLFALASFLEILFSVGIYTISLIDAYLFSVAVLVQFLSMGSLALTKKETIFKAYAGYSIAADALLAVALAVYPVGYILTNGVVFGLLPLFVTIVSSIITFPAAVILIVVGALSYRKRRDTKMLSIIAGTIVVSIAGTLYIAKYPAFLYYAEFLGIVLLWTGFVDFRYLFAAREVNKSVNG
jgi:hypothetical protein